MYNFLEESEAGAESGAQRLERRGGVDDGERCLVPPAHPRKKNTLVKRGLSQHHG
jgi:hypothetical protein